MLSRQLFEVCLGLFTIGPCAAVILYRFRRMPNPEELLASMHAIDLSNLMQIRDCVFGSRVDMDQLKKIWHNAACLVNLFSTHNVHGLNPRDHAYLREQFLRITYCAVWAIVKRSLFRSYPLFAPKLAAAIYVEMYEYAKTLAWEYRPDLIPALDQLA